MGADCEISATETGAEVTLHRLDGRLHVKGSLNSELTGTGYVGQNVGYGAEDSSPVPRRGVPRQEPGQSGPGELPRRSGPGAVPRDAGGGFADRLMEAVGQALEGCRTASLSGEPVAAHGEA